MTYVRAVRAIASGHALVYASTTRELGRDSPLDRLWILSDANNFVKTFPIRSLME